MSDDVENNLADPLYWVSCPYCETADKATYMADHIAKKHRRRLEQEFDGMGVSAINFTNYLIAIKKRQAERNLKEDRSLEKHQKKYPPKPQEPVTLYRTKTYVCPSCGRRVVDVLQSDGTYRAYDLGPTGEHHLCGDYSVSIHTISGGAPFTNRRKF